MKYKTFASVMFFSSLLCFISCNKNDDDPSNYRVVEVRNYVDNNILYTLMYQYQDEKLYSSVGFDLGVTGDSTKSQFEYPDNNSMIEWGYSKTGTEWLHSVRKEYVTDDQFVTQARLYIYSTDTLGTPYRNIDYVYDGEKLLEETWFSYSSQNYFPNFRMVYHYDGKKFTGSVHYTADHSEWVEDGKEDVYYNGSEIDSIVQNYYDLIAYFKTFKYEYEYSGGRISRVNWYQFINSTETWEPNGYQEFTYNGDGNLKTSSMEVNGLVYKSEYIYEKGKGNYEQTVYHMSGISDKVLPVPTKSSDLIYRTRINANATNFHE
jgi:hypothetical protein